MGKILVLTEKPSVAKDIARVLGCRQGADGYIAGPKYIVTWALGHLVTLADPEEYDGKYKHWNLDDLPMLPKTMKLVVIRETSRQFRTVSSLMGRKDIDELVIATDAGREGELVARWIMQKAGWRKPAKRLWISSQTDKSVKEGFANLKPAVGYDNLYYSALARSHADWLVGLNVTRALTCKHNAQLSAGRVQTPTLALITQREEEIAKFVPQEYYTVRADFGAFSALYKDQRNAARFFDAAQAAAVVEAVKGKNATVAELKKEVRYRPPPAAYDLTELQRDANKKYAYSAKQTLGLMQSLYERHKLLTYPRTDSRYIPDDVVSTLPERLRAVATGPYRDAAGAVMRTKPLNTKYLVNTAKVTDHHAIIPTEQPPDFSALSYEERNIYDLVVRRFLAVLSPTFEYEEVKLRVAVGKHSFYAKGIVVRVPGWRALYNDFSEDDAAEDADERSQQLPALSPGTALSVHDVKVVTGKTKPPARYTEATLLTAMENPVRQITDAALKSVMENAGGLGTPATRADIIEKLFNSFYIERRGKDLLPTSKGKQLIGIVPPDLTSAELTAKWEQRLQLIAQGKEKAERFTDEMRVYAASLVKQVIADSRVYTHDNVTREKCPACEKYLLDVNGKKGRMLVCPDRECGYRKSVSVQTNARCPNCHKKLELRGDGDKRAFFCVCGYRQKMSEFEKKKDGAGKRDVADYMRQQSQQQKSGSSALADQLAKWAESNEDATD